MKGTGRTVQRGPGARVDRAALPDPVRWRTTSAYSAARPDHGPRVWPTPGSTRVAGSPHNGSEPDPVRSVRRLARRRAADGHRPSTPARRSPQEASR